ncbi:hypothetical protein ACJX0J_038226, partial [Zea mays]
RREDDTLNDTENVNGMKEFLQGGCIHFFFLFHASPTLDLVEHAAQLGKPQSQTKSLHLLRGRYSGGRYQTLAVNCKFAASCENISINLTQFNNEKHLRYVNYHMTTSIPIWGSAIFYTIWYTPSTDNMFSNQVVNYAGVRASMNMWFTFDLFHIFCLKKKLVRDKIRI